jgi:preprotein translocase subunit SecB
MADENTQGGAAAAANGQAQNVSLQSVYVKDLSFEAPKGPFLPAQNQDPKIQLNLNTASSPIGTDVHEVVLTVTLEAKTGDIPVYVAEVKQGGVFTVRGFGPEDTRRILGSFAPNVLFPYVRQTVSDMISKGGFPPFFLPPVNFDALYERSLQERAAQQAAPGAGAPQQVN